MYPFISFVMARRSAGHPDGAACGFDGLAALIPSLTSYCITWMARTPAGHDRRVLHHVGASGRALARIRRRAIAVEE